MNRGVAYLTANKSTAWQDDFVRVLTLAPDNVLASRALCWGLALNKQADKAMPYCNTAVLADTETSMGRDARGVVYAEMGRTAEALVDFQDFIRWLQSQSPAIRDSYLPTRNAWVEALRASKNPIDQATLDKLRTP